LCQAPTGARVVAHLAWINDRYGKPRGSQRARKMRLQPSAGLQHDQRGPLLRQALTQAANRSLLMRNALSAPCGLPTDIQPLLRDVDSDERFVYHVFSTQPCKNPGL